MRVRRTGIGTVGGTTGLFSNRTNRRVADPASGLSGQSPDEPAGGFVHEAEVSQVPVLHEPVETAFPLPTRRVRASIATANKEQLS